MICRSTENGWFFITQPAHAWAAGQLAAAWDSSELFTPSLMEEVILATSLHDIGWSEWDKAPRIHPDGSPVNFLENNLAENKLTWERAVAQVNLYNPYAALLVSMHASTIYQRRLDRGADPEEQKKEVEDLLDQQFQIQREVVSFLAGDPIYGPAVAAAQLQANYQILRVCDLLLLAVCTGLDSFSSGDIPKVPAIDGSLTKVINFSFDEENTLSIDPYPFLEKEIILKIPGRRVEQKTFSDQQAYLDALRQALPEHLEFNLVPA